MIKSHNGLIHDKCVGRLSTEFWAHREYKLFAAILKKYGGNAAAGQSCNGKQISICTVRLLRRR